MDLPTCPSCGQSVLDDDAEVCPFCGTSMSGKPVRKSQPAPKVEKRPENKSQPPTPTSKPKTTKPASSSQKKTSKPSGDLKELGLDSIIPTDAVQASPKQTKSRRFKVVCPMCDTKGYIPANVSTREIRCPNKACLSPIFKAPEVQKTEPVNTTSTKVKKNNSKLVYASFAGIALLIGIIVIAVVLKKNPENKQPQKTKTVPDQSNNETVEKSPEEESKQPIKEIIPDEVIIDEILNKLMPDYSSSLDRNRSKAYCRRLSAIACIEAGNPDRAMEELENFNSVGSSSPYEKIFPLSEIVWYHLKDENKDKASKAAEDLFALKSTIPQQGYTAIDSATTLAAVLVAFDKKSEAIALVKKYNQSNLVGQSLALIRKSQYYQDYNIDQFSEQRRTFDTQFPQWSTVAVNLAIHGLEKKSEDWAMSCPNDFGKMECLSNLIDSQTKKLFTKDPSNAYQQIQTKISRFPELFRPILWTRAATNAINYSNEKVALQLLEQAYQATNKRPQPKSYKIPEQKILASSQITVNSEPYIDAIAAFEIARTENLLKHHEKSWKALTQSLTFLNQTAPSISQSNILLEEISQLGQQGIQNKLKKLLKLETDSTSRTAFRTYRSNCKKIKQLAEEKHAQSISILSYAIIWNFESEVLEQIKNNDEYKTSDLYTMIKIQAEQNGIQLELPKIEPNTKPSLHLSKLQSLIALKNGDVSQAIKIINSRLNSEKAWKAIQLLNITSQIAREKNIEGFDFIRNLHDPITKEIALRIYCANLSMNGFTAEAWKFCKERRERLSPTERISGLLGTIEGISVSK